MRHGSSRPHGRRALIAIVTACAVIAAAAAGGAAYLVLRTKGSPGQTASAYLADWRRGDFAALRGLVLGAPPGGLAGPLTAAARQTGQRTLALRPGRVQVTGDTATARFAARVALASGHVWAYTGLLHLQVSDRRWYVRWSPAAIYPALRRGERFALAATGWPSRAPVLSADGTVLSSPQAIAQSGSLAMITGTVAPATAAQARALGAPYRKGDPVGVGGIEQADQARLAGQPGLGIRIVDPAGHLVSTAAKFPAVAGQPVRTSIDMRDQLAASAAVSGAATGKPVDMVALQPSTGKVLAVVERPGGFDRAVLGEFPPGSTFKVVTASALARRGMRPSSPVQCPATVTIGGRVFHNDNNEQLGSTNLQTAFAVSCNSTFAMLAAKRLTGPSLAAMARQFGFNAGPALGIPGALATFRTPHQPLDLAADAFGQGTDIVNPLSQAAVAAAIDDGTWRPPQLVTSPAQRQSARPHPISAQILATLRPMMRAVVTSGTAAGVGFGPGVYGKTGTAEYGTGPNPQAHGWFIGYRGDLAFAVLVEGGGFGASSAGPIAKAFLSRV